MDSGCAPAGNVRIDSNRNIGSIHALTFCMTPDLMFPLNLKYKKRTKNKKKN
jgi:DUF4097 and DUF4098 domain-containing protein YvlB